MRVAIIGTGKIGTDLLHKLRILDVEIVGFVGRRNVPRPEPEYCPDGIDFFKGPKCCDVVFDCTDAESARVNNIVFASKGIRVIDLTPSRQGFMCVPNVNCDRVGDHQNISMITCGGQVSIPLVSLLAGVTDYVEVITQISSESAGGATRANIDEYIHTTEHAIKELTGLRSKVILNINPSPDAPMKTTVMLKADVPDLSQLAISEYVPNYRLGPITRIDDVVSIPSYIENSELPGNLDIINRAAIKILKKLMDYKTYGCDS
jgi:acetaldehyde dehydrogenase